jgi:hypothetical protein
MAGSFFFASNLYLSTKTKIFELVDDVIRLADNNDISMRIQGLYSSQCQSRDRTSTNTDVYLSAKL